MNSGAISRADLTSPVSAAALRQLAEDLARLIAPNEAAFMTLGDALGTARARLRAGGGLFRDLSAMIDREEGTRAVAALAAAREDILRISAGTDDVAAWLGRLDLGVGAIARPLANLAKIIGEIGALGTSAKVLAAQITGSGIDFTVFTSDIGHLRVLAENAADRATRRLGELGAGMASARRAAAEFQRRDAAELRAVGGGLSERLRQLAQRGEQAQRSIHGFEQRTAAIGERISRCIGELQINDLTIQRIEHVRTALTLLRAVVEPNLAAELGCDWLAELESDRQRMLVAAICDLQARQLTRANADFAAEIGGLKANLAALAADADGILAEARALFGGGGGGDESFVRSVSADVQRAARLLGNYCDADERIRDRIAGVSAGFAAMTEDLAAIQSIDSDMRIMGLNATLKCTRLGPSGRALGVVAQELRGCSHRTEETSEAIAVAIKSAADEALALAERSADGRAAAMALAETMVAASDSMGAFCDLLERTLDGLAAACGQVSTLLGRASEEFAVERRLSEGSNAIARRIEDIGAQVWPASVDPDLVRDDIQRMLGQHYTMESERRVHGGSAHAEPAVPAQGSAGDQPGDIDDLFF